MKTAEVKLLYQYGNWATQRMLATCERVSREQYIAALGHPSLRATLVHVLDAQSSWRQGFLKSFFPAERVRSGTHLAEIRAWDSPEINEAEIPALDDLNARWQAEEQEMDDYLNSLHDADLDGYVCYKIPGGIIRERVLWHCLLHVANHGTQHRSEAAMMLTALGQSPGEVDFTAFLNEHFKLQME
jgi:uncharacterized damage-inducible protein DinB